MALSLNEGSYGLLMDPLNGVADIENRELRLVSNYGFIEDPVRMIRAARLMARLGWTLEEKTQARYETGRDENYLEAMDAFHRGYETEEIFHEDDPLRVLRRMEEEGWLAKLAPALSVAKANAVELDRLREVQAQLQMQALMVDSAALNFPLITAKLSPADVAALKKSFPRQGFVIEIESLDAAGREFSGRLTGKSAALPSQSYQLMRRSPAEVVLWTAFHSKSPAVQAKFKSFSNEWPQARLRLPYTLLQEMRITPELPDYDSLIEKIFFELMDGRLTTNEQMKEFLEPFSPPAPPPPVSLRRPRAPKKEAKSRSRKKEAAAAVDEAEGPSTPAETPAGVAPPEQAPSPVSETVLSEPKPAPKPLKEKAAAKPAAAGKTDGAVRPSVDGTEADAPKPAKTGDLASEQKTGPGESKVPAAPVAPKKTAPAPAAAKAKSAASPTMSSAPKEVASPAAIPGKSKSSPSKSAKAPASTKKIAPTAKATPTAKTAGKQLPAKKASPAKNSTPAAKKKLATPEKNAAPAKSARPSPAAKKSARPAPPKKQTSAPAKFAKSAPSRPATKKAPKKRR